MLRSARPVVTAIRARALLQPHLLPTLSCLRSKSTAHGAREAVYMRPERVPPPPHLDPKYNPSREAAYEYFDKHGFDAEGRLEWPVQWGDSDMFRHTNNVAYVRFLETSRMRYCESLVPDFGPELSRDFMEGRRTGWILKEQKLSYKVPVTYPDSLIWAVKPHALDQKHSSFKLEHVAWSLKHKRVAIHAESWAVIYDFEALKRGEMTDFIRDVIQSRIEAGKRLAAEVKEREGK